MPEDKKKILLVEDEADYLEIMRLALGRADFEVFTAGNGEAGLAVALAERPDLILLDIMMPKVDGIEMLRRLRADAWGKFVPVFLLSNLDTSEAIETSLGKGAYDYFIKAHWKVDDVIAKIKQRLDCK